VELFDALDTAVHKRPGAFWLVITTAGHDKTSLLGRLYSSMLAALELEEKTGFVAGRDEFNGVLLNWYGAAEDADADDRKLWRAVNPASFVTIDALRKQRNSPSMSSATFARLHLNAWVAPDIERWIPTDTWERLAGTVEIPDGSTVFVGADGDYLLQRLLSVVMGAALGLALGILVSVTAGVPFAPEVGLLLGWFAAKLRR
jgi:phage terminase large subunit-like protein